MVQFKIVKSAICCDKEHVLVDEKTMEMLKEAGFGAHECYKTQNTFNFVAQLMSDTTTVTRLQELLPEGDTKPIIFELGENIGSVLNWKSKNKGELFGGQNWCGALADFENAWVVYSTNSYR